MPIDQFTRERFELALPVHRETNLPLWIPQGVQAGEYCYTVPVKAGVMIFVRSSLKASGVAADAAKDSIRCWLAADEFGEPLGSKVERWISRVNGWDQRMTKTLRKLYMIGLQLGPCPKCQKQQSAFIVKKEDSANKGRWFSTCRACGQFGKWLTSAEESKDNA